MEQLTKYGFKNVLSLDDCGKKYFVSGFVTIKDQIKYPVNKIIKTSNGSPIFLWKNADDLFNFPYIKLLCRYKEYTDFYTNRTSLGGCYTYILNSKDENLFNSYKSCWKYKLFAKDNPELITEIEQIFSSSKSTVEKFWMLNKQRYVKILKQLYLYTYLERVSLDKVALASEIFVEKILL